MSTPTWYYKREPERHIADTQHLTHAQQGIYCLLIDYYYVHRGFQRVTSRVASADANRRTGYIDALAALTRCFSPESREDLTAMLDEFFTWDGTNFTHRKCERVIAERFEEHEKKSKAGRARANGHRNADGTLAGSGAGAEAPASNSDSKSHSNSQSHKESDSDRKEEQGFSAEFESFWNLWPAGPRKGAKGECWRLWQSGDYDSIAGDIKRHVEGLSESKDWRKDGGAFIPAPKVYLTERRWEGAEQLVDPFEEMLRRAK